MADSPKTLNSFLQPSFWELTTSTIRKAVRSYFGPLTFLWVAIRNFPAILAYITDIRNNIGTNRRDKMAENMINVQLLKEAMDRFSISQPALFKSVMTSAAIAQASAIYQPIESLEETRLITAGSTWLSTPEGENK